MPTRVEFTEEMKGSVKLGESEYEKGAQFGQPLTVHLIILTEDIDLFLVDPQHRGSVEGYVNYDSLGGQLTIEKGEFNCLVDDQANTRKIFYRLYFSDIRGARHTLSGKKIVRHDGIQNVWRDTSTLFTRIFQNYIDAELEETQDPEAAGIIHIRPLDFVQELTTFRVAGVSYSEEIEAIAKFGRFFLGALWDVYKPKWGSIYSHKDGRQIPLFTLRGVKNAEISTHYISTQDHLGLSMFRFTRIPCKDVVVLLHGLTTSSDMFIMPEHYNIVNYLLDHGYTDVWSFDWRGSMRYSYDLFPADFTMDDIALYDMPAAFSKIRQVIGHEARIHVICHCVGSLTFMMSLYAGLIDGITSVISNSVSLTPRVPPWCRVKLAVAPLLFPQATDFNPRWAYYPGIFSFDKWLSKWISLWHWECRIPACHVVSFMWGSGHPAAWMHENLDEVTHRRTGDLFGSVNINYYRHIRKMVGRGAAVKMYPDDSQYDLLPNEYLEHAKKVDIPVLFVSGENNRVFMDSNVRTFETLHKLNPTQQNELRVFRGYGHQDPFMGKNSDKDIFPAFLNFLERHSK
jgi:cholesterol oxidase